MDSMANTTKTRQAKPADASPIAMATSAAERQQLESAERIKTEIALIDTHLPAILRRVQDAEDGAGETAEIEHRLTRFEDVPEGAYAHAVEADLIAKVRAGLLPNRRAALVRSLPGDSTVIAQKIKPLLEALLPGVEVVATHAPVRTWEKYIPADVVGVVLVQEPGHEVDRSTGLVSGKVTVHYFRLPLFASIDVGALERAAKAARINVEVSNNSPGDRSTWLAATGVSEQKDRDPNTLVRDRLTLNVSNVMDGLPTIVRVDPSGVRSREWVTAALRQHSPMAGPVPVDRGRVAHQWRVNAGPYVHVTGHPAEVRSEVVSDARRTVVVEQKINTHNVDPSDFTQALRGVLESEVGFAVAGGLGLLVDADVKSGTDNRMARTTNLTVTLTYDSKMPGTRASA